MSDTAALNELDKEEMWDVSRVLKPEITREEYDQLWASFIKDKEAHEREKALQ